MTRIAYINEGTSALKPTHASSHSALRVIEPNDYERVQASQHPQQRLHSNFYTHEIGVDQAMLSTPGIRVGRDASESKLLIAIGSLAGVLMFAGMTLFSLL